MGSNPLPGQPDHQGLSLKSICLPEFSKHAKFHQAALLWHIFGFSVIPVIPGTKQTAVKWDSWLDSLSDASISRHWLQHPDHEIGLIVGDSYVVFDADSQAAVSVLQRMENEQGVIPLLVVKTRRGEHHYFRKDAALRGKTGGVIVGGSEDRIDIKTGRTMVILPPSTDKILVKLGGDHA